MTVDDYGDKTLLAILYAVQNGYPLRDLTRYQREKIKKMFEGGYKIKFYQKYANQVLTQTIMHYFLWNDKVNWDKRIFKK